MNRKQRRSINTRAKKVCKKSLLKKGRIQKRLDSIGFPNGMEEVNEYKKMWIGYIRITGPKAVPTTTYRLGRLMIRYNIENLYIALFGYVLKIKNWTIRTKLKPRGSFFNYVVTLRKRKA